MVEKNKIFIGSSSEALGIAERVREVIIEAGLEPLLWTDRFPAGVILLEEIENLPSEIQGAIFLCTPDMHCTRGEEESFDAPVANVVFEYGYLAARLTRKRVAICQFGGASIPSDLQGLMVVRSREYNNNTPQPLPAEAKRKLYSWLKDLPSMVDGIPPSHQLHGYSGMWKVETRFSRWKGLKLGQNDWVTFNGTTYLLIPMNGEKGSGTQIGKLDVSIDSYKAKFQIANLIDSAIVTKLGTLKMHVQVVSRKLIGDKPPPDPRFPEELFGSQDFDLKGEPASGKDKRLNVKHEYAEGLPFSQEGEEEWNYLGL